MRIYEVKRGPFHEHSSQLYSIATGVTSWKKVNSGLFKMYEVRSTTRNVVQQLYLNGGFWVLPSGGGPRKARGSPASAVGRGTGVECRWRSAHCDWRLLEPHLYCDASTSGTGDTVNGTSSAAIVTSVPWGSSSASIGEGGSTGSSSPCLCNFHLKVS
jgi:hypothetical protein